MNINSIQRKTSGWNPNQLIRVTRTTLGEMWWTKVGLFCSWMFYVFYSVFQRDLWNPMECQVGGTLEHDHLMRDGNVRSCWKVAPAEEKGCTHLILESVQETGVVMLQKVLLLLAVFHLDKFLCFCLFVCLAEQLYQEALKPSIPYLTQSSD